MSQQQKSPLKYLAKTPAVSKLYQEVSSAARSVGVEELSDLLKTINLGDAEDNSGGPRTLDLWWEDVYGRPYNVGTHGDIDDLAASDSSASSTNSNSKKPLKAQHAARAAQTNEEEVRIDKVRFESLPTLEEFEAGSGEIIERGDIVQIDTAPGVGEEWYSRVLDIRVEEIDGVSDDAPDYEKQKIWFKSHWFYTIDHLESHVETKKNGKRDPKSNPFPFRPSDVSENELVEVPNHVEFYIADICKCLAPVRVIHEAEERDVNQSPLPPGHLYSRIVYYVDYPKTHKLHQVPRNRCCCASEPRPKGLGAGRQRFCPQKGCLRWLHESCLQKYTIKSTGSKSLESLLLDNVPEDVNISDYTGLIRSKVPSDLLAVLQAIGSQPIVRAKGNPLGNMPLVCLARFLVKLSGSYGLQFETISWEAVAESEMIKPKLDHGEDDNLPPVQSCFRCPFCRQAV